MDMNVGKQPLRVAGVDYTYADWGWYTHDPISITAGNPGQATINIDKGSDFEVFSLDYFASVAGAAQTDSSRVIPLVRVNFNDTGSQKDWSTKPAPLSAIAGIGELPMLLLHNRILLGNSTLTLAFTNDAAATDYANLQVVLVGRKLYGRPANQ